MDIQRAIDFLHDQHRAILSTRRSDGSPQLSPVAVAADDDGRILISTRETAIKAKNLARDPRASLCVINDSFYGQWIQVDGTAEIIHLPDALELLVDYYRRISGEHPDWTEYRSAMNRDQRLILRISIERAGPDISG
ncbi:MAG TPA: PPOX class F420-dependent oxidoreductase [Streptosporangiaceae bacterium]|nr:PPOX class F420-dependent oxidoreductase [Streptosporangiaceae bacterium]